MAAKQEIDSKTDDLNNQNLEKRLKIQLAKFIGREGGESDSRTKAAVSTMNELIEAAKRMGRPFSGFLVRANQTGIFPDECGRATYLDSLEKGAELTQKEEGERDALNAFFIMVGIPEEYVNSNFERTAIKERRRIAEVTDQATLRTLYPQIAIRLSYTRRAVQPPNPLMPGFGPTTVERRFPSSIAINFNEREPVGRAVAKRQEAYPRYFKIA